MSKVSELIERYGPSFCVQPWKHLHICDTGVCRICCTSPPLCDSNKQFFTVYGTPLEGIWNSEAMREVRRAMVEGEIVPDCVPHCMDIEAVGGISRRLNLNRAWETGWIAKEGLSIDDLKADALRNNFYVRYAPFDMDIEVDNVCNLSCRMCDADRSSRVEKDPVHRQWAPRLWLLPKWEENVLELVRPGPNHLIALNFEGFLGASDMQQIATLWTQGNARIDIPNVNEHLESLEICLSPETLVNRLRILANDVVVFSNMDGQPLPRKITVDLNRTCSDLSLHFESETRYSDRLNAAVGIGLERLAIKRDPGFTPATQLLYSRFPGKKHWMKEDDFLFKELFPDGVQQQGLKIVGGEPLINQDVIKVIKHLASHGDAKQQRINFTTNGTVYNEEVINLAKNFKRMIIAVSIDGLGKSIEYIRHGVRWQTVKNNLERMKSAENVYLMISNTLQAYNALEVADVYRFCDQNNLPCFSIVLVRPRHLSIAALPPKVRETAARRLRQYIEDSKDSLSQNKMRAMALVNALESERNPFDPRELNKMMLFTNDLDRSRGESIRETFPELVRLIEEEGYPWIADTFYSGSAGDGSI